MFEIIKIKKVQKNVIKLFIHLKGNESVGVLVDNLDEFCI